MNVIANLQVAQHSRFIVLQDHSAIRRNGKVAGQDAVLHRNLSNEAGNI
jgi:hypothetical protein